MTSIVIGKKTPQAYNENPNPRRKLVQHACQRTGASEGVGCRQSSEKRVIALIERFSFRGKQQFYHIVLNSEVGRLLKGVTIVAR